MKLDCRFCLKPLTTTFVDLGMSPIANDNIEPDKAGAMEPFYPLHVYICTNCWLAQLPNIKREEEIFTDNYAYFSSFSDSWLKHAKDYVEMMTKRFGYNKDSYVVELASNDGYLLQYFKENGVPVMGVEPCANVAEAGQKKGIPAIVDFFGVDVAEKMKVKGQSADLIIANNVTAHVPDINDFIGGVKVLLKPGGVVTMEFQHLMRLIERNQFDTIYHEHYAYYSLIAIETIFAKHGLTIFDVEQVPTHGGSMRIFGRHTEDVEKPVLESVTSLKKDEIDAGYTTVEMYQAFEEKVKKVKRDLLTFLISAKNEGKTIVAYGAPAKGNTLLNYCGIRTDFVDYTVDRSPHKQNLLLPGTHIPIMAPEKIAETKPDYVLILPWNLRKEVAEQMAHIRDWGGKFVVPIPTLEIF